MSLIRSILLISFFLCRFSSTACESTIIIRLENNRGGFFSGQKVSLISRADKSVYSAVSNASGEAILSVPCLEMFDVIIIF
jgi:hypothetical protein